MPDATAARRLLTGFTAVVLVLVVLHLLTT
jgi:hypothetical protein